MKVAIYARCSTLNGQDPTTQTRELQEYCARRGWTVVGEYVDVGISGTKEKRPELDRLMADAHRRRCDAVAVWRFDRMARSVSHLLRVLETFRALGIEFVSLSEQIKQGKKSFRDMGMHMAYSGSPAHATKEEGDSLYEMLAHMITTEVLEGLATRTA